MVIGAPQSVICTNMNLLLLEKYLNLSIWRYFLSNKIVDYDKSPFENKCYPGCIPVIFVFPNLL